MTLVDVEKAFAAQNQHRALPRRFYRQVAPVETDAGHRVELDGRPLRTPGKNLMLLPSRDLAAAITQEWQSCGETIDPAAMPLTRIANTVLDRVKPQRAAVCAEIARYGETDLVCYRADWPEALVDRQTVYWDPYLTIAAQQFGAVLHTGKGIAPVTQDGPALQALAAIVDALNDWQLAPLHSLVTITGSLLIGLAVLHGHADAGTGWQAGQLDTDFQAAQWGSDPLAEAASLARRRDYDAAIRFLGALGRQALL